MTAWSIACDSYNNLNRNLRNLPLDRYDLPAKSTQIDRKCGILRPSDCLGPVKDVK